VFMSRRLRAHPRSDWIASVSSLARREFTYKSQSSMFDDRGLARGDGWVVVSARGSASRGGEWELPSVGEHCCVGGWFVGAACKHVAHGGSSCCVAPDRGPGGGSHAGGGADPYPDSSHRC
jgi:hypothetical protein